MLDTSALGGAFGILLGSWGPWLVVLPGLLIGLIFGAVPGLSGGMALAIALPFTVFMDFVSAMLFLTAIFTGVGTGTAFPAILINVPGTAASVATAFDGYPMARQGLHNEALGIGIAASAFAEALAYVVLLLLIEPIARFAILLGPPEMLVIVIWGLTLIAALRSRSVAKGLLAGAFGLVLGTIGTGVLGHPRGTLGILELLDGVPAVPALTGIFLAGDLFAIAGAGYIVASKELRRLSLGRLIAGMRMTFDYPAVLLRGSIIGAVIGATPGVGSAVASLMAYNEARRNAKDRLTFGQGNPKGVVASESANSSSEGGSMATLLALGIPGSGGTAIMLAAFQTHNILGGPRFMTEHRDIVYAVIIGNLLQSLLIVVVGVAFAYVVASLVTMPSRVLVPSVLVIATLGCYALTDSMLGPITLFVFVLIGKVMHRYEYPVAATVVGLLLTRATEGELLRTYQIAGGEFAYLLERPFALGLGALVVFVLVWPLVRSARPRNHRSDIAFGTQELG